MKTILLDTNFLTIPLQLKLDIFNKIKSEIPGSVEFVTLSACVNEIPKKYKKVVEFLLKRGVRIIHTKVENNVDDTILSVCKKRNYLLSTNDRELRKRAKTRGIKTIYLRQRKTINIE